jgi:SNF2 family DNA or RNA helicase
MGNPKKSTYKCINCGAVLWQDTYDKTKKTSLINFIKVKNIKFDVIIQDEIHQSNNANSIIGNASKTLLNHGKKHILLSGTSNNGYASSLYNLLSGLIPNTLLDNEIDSEEKFVKTYGTLMAVTSKKDGEYYSRGRSEIKDSDWVETEGINPIVFTKFLSQNYIFSTLNDLGKDLPEIHEKYVVVEHLTNMLMNENRLINDIKTANAFNSKMYDATIVRHYVNNPYHWGVIPIEKAEIQKEVQPINLKKDIILPKEKELINIIKQELSEKRKVWIYTDFTGESCTGQYMQGENIPERIIRHLKNEGIKVFWLKPSIKPIDRKEVIEKNKDKYDVFLSNPKLTEVGINMVWCSTYIVYIPSYQVNVITQAIRRGYRANSTQENRIYHMYYRNTIEEDICTRYQKKVAESQAIEGKFNVQIEDESIRTASALGKKINDSIII